MEEEFWFGVQRCKLFLWATYFYIILAWRPFFPAGQCISTRTLGVPSRSKTPCDWVSLYCIRVYLVCISYCSNKLDQSMYFQSTQLFSISFDRKNNCIIHSYVCVLLLRYSKILFYCIFLTNVESWEIQTTFT